MIANADATLYHRGTDPVTRQYTWTREELRGVLWQDERHVSVGDRSFSAADSVLVMIPGLDAEPAVEDRIVRGIVPDIAPPEDALTIMSAVRVDFGSEAMRHWEVTAK